MTIDELAQVICDLPHTNNRHLVAVAGPPASGKSTLAEKLASAITAKARPAQVVPMDGFHLDNTVLDRIGLRQRKGAPETFDVAGFIQLINALKPLENITYPLFDRSVDATQPDAGQIDAQTDIAIIEGNYLLFDEGGWEQLAPFWDISVWLDVPSPTLRQRLVQRWLDEGYSLADATKKAEANDIPNALRVSHCASFADIRLT